MREIKFRGMNIQGRWFKGNLSVIKNKINVSEPGSYISNAYGMPFAYMVRPETVGQYTGLKDKNGKEIYEGDILFCEYLGFTTFNALVRFGEYEQDGSGAEYSPSRCVGFYAEAINKNQEDEWGCKIVSDYMQTSSLLDFAEFEVIGNIYENTELLEGASL